MSASDAWTAAREALLDGGSACLLADRRFCPDAPEDLDPHVQKLLDRQRGGVMPESRASAESLGRQARASYRGWWQKDPTGRARVLERVRGVFEHPTVTVERGEVRADLGLAPGEFVDRARGMPQIERSDAIADEHLRADLLAARLGDLRASHPDAGVFVLTLKVPRPGQAPASHTYRWQVDPGILRVTRTDRAGGSYVGEGLSLDALAAGTARIGASDLRWTDPSGPR